MTALWLRAMMVVGLSTITSGAQTVRSGAVRVIVTDQTGAPIPQARVTVLSPEGQLLAFRKAGWDGQLTVDFDKQQYLLCVEEAGFVAREVHVDQRQRQPVVLELRVGECTNCFPVRSIPADSPFDSPAIAMADNSWVTDRSGDAFLPHACMLEWAERNAAMTQPITEFLPEIPGLDNVWLSDVGASKRANSN